MTPNGRISHAAIPIRINTDIPLSGTLTREQQIDYISRPLHPRQIKELRKLKQYMYEYLADRNFMKWHRNYERFKRTLADKGLYDRRMEHEHVMLLYEMHTRGNNQPVRNPATMEGIRRQMQPPYDVGYISHSPRGSSKPPLPSQENDQR
jgi:hypothetical protein